MRASNGVRAALVALAMGVATVTGVRPADACGGMFCDSGPQSMPIDQRGENILFSVDRDAGTVEAHIQIQYQGEASRFAWVIPVQSLPTLSVGSQPLFDALLQASVPTYGYATQRDQCSSNGTGTGGSGISAGDGAGGKGSAGADPGGGPTVVYQAQVGAFEAVVLSGGTASEVVKWLDDNGYQQNPAAEPILQEYLTKNYLFVAVKLTGGTGVDEIHPLVVKYHGDQPCVPLKLTAIAATEDRGVRTFFLDDGRWVPTNYKHIELNPVRLDWQQFAGNYVSAVSHAADSDLAMGQAFVTEYAGPSSVVSSGGIYSGSWQPSAFVSLPAVEVESTLEAQGLMQCGVYVQGGPNGYGQGCVYNHPLLKSILDEFVPVPAGLSSDEFYWHLDQYAAQIDQKAWDGAAFAARLTERIVAPGQHAMQLLGSWPYLTRLFTTISPAEMSVDPEFHARHDLPEVRLGGQGNQRILCSGQSGIRLPDARDVALTESNTWPSWTDEMPWAESISQIPMTGDPVVLRVNTPKIDELLAKWNASRNWPPPAVGQPGAGGAGGTSGAGATGGTGGKSPEVGGGGCQTSGGEGAGWLLALAAGFFASERRRRASRS